ncbi:peptide chain release factor GTP-binding subunit [Seminavis robusta]|uniref:Peptide chain release factor GTP-binding subunit n=1 Tax=Seminavis robusta TaxID=568900 RepID=A0A9N8DVJ5_9STRA|nr:peptide chain release factor GTP-binding subunit [Seminavis robusta]|eukprot:Sro314_g115030.1 peptide chain release factor GTP-binding subunit (146) ;mRNA; r:21358-21795
MGKVESGIISPGMRVTVMPTRKECKVDEARINENPVAGARPGENVLIKLNGANIEDVRKGFVICSSPPCRAAKKFICHIDITDVIGGADDMAHNNQIMTAGFQCVYHAHNCAEECTVSNIFETPPMTNEKSSRTHHLLVLACMLL